MLAGKKARCLDYIAVLPESAELPCVPLCVQVCDVLRRSPPEPRPGVGAAHLARLARGGRRQRATARSRRRGTLAAARSRGRTAGDGRTALGNNSVAPALEESRAQSINVVNSK